MSAAQIRQQSGVAEHRAGKPATRLAACSSFSPPRSQCASLRLSGDSQVAALTPQSPIIPASAHQNLLQSYTNAPEVR
ncbi:hypothetical protein EYF80_035778 [Liparis tanakae]|uniref:Uncharacterized protein n=1 Tax=Liparis tanakae TaxID=230148 RepID=A0A4Z2GLB7_9TELE|nr:hypothetical protein EYF80_035778 [Liparis tanakae]